MTEVIIIGEEPKEEKLRPIEFVKRINTDFILSEPLYKPNSFEKITVLKKSGAYKYDLFICTNEDGYEIRFIGHLNDGVVE